MIEPIYLKNVATMKDEKLYSAMLKYRDGEALTVSFIKPKALFIGVIPRQVAVIWKYNNSDELHVQKSGCTYFLWNHSIEYLVITGLVSHVYHVGELDISVTFHVFDPIKFVTHSNPDELDTKLEDFIIKMFSGRENESFRSTEFYKYLSDKFMESNRIFQPLGVGITAIDPPGFN